MSLKVLIAGQEGMVGQAIYNFLKKKKFRIIDCKRRNLDFTCQKSVENWFKKKKPNIVINAAGRVGGIWDNFNFQSDYLYINTMIGMNIVNSSLKYNVQKLINIGSSCIYPKKTIQPIKEEALLSSALEKTNEGYALAKIVTLKYCQYLKQKKQKKFISIQPVNLYGIGDNFDLNSSHVLPALVKKFTLAKIKKKKTVEVWGTGRVKREFLNVEDLAEAIYLIIKKDTNFDYINVGGGEVLSIKQLAKMIKKIINYNGKIIFNKKYPDGVRIRKIDSSKIRKMGWYPKIKIQEGLKSYCDYYINEIFPLEK